MFKGRVSLKSQVVPYTVQRNPRARRVLLKVEEAAGLVVVLPRWGVLERVPPLLHRNADWILKHLRRREELLKEAPPPLGEGRKVWYRGRVLPLKVQSVACTDPSVEWHRDRVVVKVPREGRTPVGSVLEAAFREKAREVLGRRVEAYAGLVGVRPRRLSIRDQKTRWGSCTAQRTITFNWRLLLAPPAVLDYVVVHELCHLRRPHHGPSFWELVGSILPGYEGAKGWLDRYGPLLLLR